MSLRLAAPRGGPWSALILALTTIGCGGTGPRPAIDPAVPTDVEVGEETSSFAASAAAERLENLLRSGDVTAARELVQRREETQQGEADGETRFLRGRVLEAERRGSEAVVAYLGVAGAPGGREFGAAAWDGIARLRAQSGDREGAARADLRAYDYATASDRERRRTVLSRRLQELTVAELGRLEAAMQRTDAGPLVADALQLRRQSSGVADELVIALLAPLTGKFEEFGNAFALGARLALRDRDSAASAPARRIRLVTRGTEGDVLRATQEAQAAIAEDGATAIVGPLLSLPSLAAGGVAIGAGVPLVAPTATDPRLAELEPYVTTLSPDPYELTRPLADFAVRELGHERFGVLLAEDGFTQAFEEAFRLEVERLGGRVVESIAYAPGERDFRKLLERLQEANVEAVYVPGGLSVLEELAGQMAFYEFDRKILGNGGWTDSRVLDAGNPALEGALFAVPAAEYPDSDFRIRLRNAVYREAKEDLTRFHVRGYLAMASVLRAIDQGADGGEAIAELLRLRDRWRVRSEAEVVHLLTYRDGVLGPASWASGFDLVPKRSRASEGEEAAGGGGTSESPRTNRPEN